MLIILDILSLDFYRLKEAEKNYFSYCLKGMKQLISNSNKSVK